jgi:hypothetical protein
MRIVTDAVDTGVGPESLISTMIDDAPGAKVKSHGPALLSVQSTQKQHDERGVLLRTLRD